MLKFNRTTEYGLLALRLINRKSSETPQSRVSAREIADHYGLPFEITAKTLQRLKERGLVRSEQGALGGYLLLRPLHDVKLGEFIEMMEGPQGVVPCTTGEICGYHAKCEIRSMMGGLNEKVKFFLAGINLAEIADETLGLNSEALEAQELHQ